MRHALTVLVALSLFTGTLLMGWGWEDLLQWFAHPARGTLLVVLMLHLAVSVACSKPLNPSQKRRGGRLGRAVFWLAVSAGVLLVASSAFWDRRILFVLPGGDLTRFLGLGLSLVGFALNTWQPGRNERRRSGVLTESGFIVAALGVPMVFLSTFGLAGGTLCAALMIARMVWRARTSGVKQEASESRLEAA